MEAVKFNAELIFQQRAWRSLWNRKALWMVYMRLNIIQLPQGSTLSRLHGVGTTSLKGEWGVVLFELFVSFGGLHGWLAFYLTACFRAAEALGKLGRLICISLTKPKVMSTKKIINFGSSCSLDLTLSFWRDLLFYCQGLQQAEQTKYLTLRICCAKCKYVIG